MMGGDNIFPEKHFLPVQVSPLSGITYNDRMFIWTEDSTQVDTTNRRNYFFTVNFPRFRTGDFSDGISYQAYEYNVYLASYSGTSTSVSDNITYVNEVSKIKLLKSFRVEAHDENSSNFTQNIEIFFTINNNAPTNIGLYFELVPTLYDYHHPSGENSRIYAIWNSQREGAGAPVQVDSISEFCLIGNMITGNTTWSKIGVQTRPGVLLVVNRQPIRVGRSGIYEIYNGINIFQIAIITPGASTDYTKMDNFIIDYAYQS